MFKIREKLLRKKLKLLLYGLQRLSVEENNYLQSKIRQGHWHACGAMEREKKWRVDEPSSSFIQLSYIRLWANRSDKDRNISTPPPDMGFIVRLLSGKSLFFWKIVNAIFSQKMFRLFNNHVNLKKTKKKKKLINYGKEKKW